jgi:hypothetical protein
MHRIARSIHPANPRQRGRIYFQPACIGWYNFTASKRCVRQWGDETRGDETPGGTKRGFVVSIETEFPEREARHRALCGGQRERLLAGSLAPSRPCGSDAMVDPRSTVHASRIRARQVLSRSPALTIPREQSQFISSAARARSSSTIFRNVQQPSGIFSFPKRQADCEKRSQNSKNAPNPRNCRKIQHMVCAGYVTWTSRDLQREPLGRENQTKPSPPTKTLSLTRSCRRSKASFTSSARSLIEQLLDWRALGADA